MTFSPAARAFGVEPHKGLLLVGLPGCGKDLSKKVAASVLGRSLSDLEFGAVMGEGGGIIGSASTSIRRALSIATTRTTTASNPLASASFGPGHFWMAQLQRDPGLADTGSRELAMTGRQPAAQSSSVVLDWRRRQTGLIVPWAETGVP